MPPLDSRRTHLIVIFGAVAIAILVNQWAVPAAKRVYYRADREALLAELQPIVLKNCTLKRYGSSRDGGYLMCDNLIDRLETAYSYGVGPNDDWGCQVSREFSVPVHQYDCFDPARPRCDGGSFTFHDECSGPKPETLDSRLFDTLVNQIAKNGDSGRRMIVKIDIEGAEWDSLLATPDEALAQIDQMPMELHAVYGIDDPRILPVVQKLKRTFYIANLHFNNQACVRDADPFPSLAFQALLVNKRLAEPDRTAATPAPFSPLNAPDDPQRPDCQLPEKRN